MKIFRYLPFGLLLLFSNCSPVIITPEAATVITTSTAPIAVSTSVPASSPSFASPEPTSSISLAQKCPVVQSSILEKESLSGYLILYEGMVTIIDATNIFALNLANDLKSPLLSDEIENVVKLEPSVYTISPDRLWFVYFKRDMNNQSVLYLGSTVNESQKSLYWDSDWGDSAIWLSQEWLFIPPNPNRQFPLMLNPFTGEWRELNPRFPSGLNFSFPFYYYNSNLSNAVYVSGDNYVLWDANSNTDIWTKPTFGPYLAPKWSQDGSRAALIIRDEVGPSGIVRDQLVLVDQQGFEINVTDFLQSYEETNSIEINAFDWSTDNRHIAFSLEVMNTSNELVDSTLFVLDTLTNQAVDYCFSIRRNSNLVWSPDGKYLAFELSQNDNSVVLLNIAQDWAASIVQNVTLLGWMVAP